MNVNAALYKRSCSVAPTALCELESGIIPLLEKEGWMRDQENVAKQP